MQGGPPPAPPAAPRRAGLSARRLCRICRGGIKQNQNLLFFWNLLLFEICCFFKICFEICCFLKFVFLLNLLLLSNAFFSKMCCFWNLLFYEICCFSYTLFFAKSVGEVWNRTYENVEAYGWSENEIGTKLFEIVPKLHSPQATKRLPTRVVTW